MNKIVMIAALMFWGLNVPAYSINDTLVDTTLQDIELTAPEINLDYNYLDTDKVEINLEITEPISTGGKNKAYEGQPVVFKVKKNVIYNGEVVVRQGTPVTAKIDIVSTRGVAGIPAEIQMKNFEIPNIKSSQLVEPVIKRGQNRTLWILPLKWALTPLPPSGSFTNLVIGGQANIKPRDTIKIYYYPNW